MNETITVNKKEYTVIKLLGKGKGGYSYLVNNDGLLFTLKQIHHEPCEYYNFGNKIEAELRDYERLLQIGIMLPKLIYCDKEKEIIIKEFIDGKTIVEIIKDGEFKEDYLKQVMEMQKICRNNNLNIDWYPTNFIVQSGMLYYIDYECNQYMDEWSFENWGSKYWSDTEKFKEAFGKEKNT